MIGYVSAILAYFFAFFCLTWDSILTVKGVAAGIAEEEDKIPAWVFQTPHPALWQYLVVRGVERALYWGIIFLPTPTGLPELWNVAATVGLLVWGVKSLRCAVQWKWMFAHPGKTIPPQNGFWAQFFGFWG